MVKRIPITDNNLSDHQFGTDDVLTGFSSSTNVVFGDAGKNILDHARGGDDGINADGPFSTLALYGDAVGNIYDNGAGGNDTLNANVSPTDPSLFVPVNLSMYGDVGGNMSGHESWSRLSEQNLRLDKWSFCRS
jgi:hypothetical protein